MSLMGREPSLAAGAGSLKLNGRNRDKHLALLSHLSHPTARNARL
jgi:hypothetical protein